MGRLLLASVAILLVMVSITFAETPTSGGGGGGSAVTTPSSGGGGGSAVPTPVSGGGGGGGSGVSAPSSGGGGYAVACDYDGICDPGETAESYCYECMEEGPYCVPDTCNTDENIWCNNGYLTTYNYCDHCSDAEDCGDATTINDYKSKSECPEVYTCPDGTEVAYCEIVRYEAEGGSGGGGGAVGCICPANPEEQCPSSPASGGGAGGSGGSTVTTPSSGGGAGGGSVIAPAPEEMLTCAFGCEYEETCVSHGTRVMVGGASSYCYIDNEWKVQKEVQDACQNNYECKSNFCTNGKCVDIEKELKETRTLLERVLGFLRRFFP